MSRAEAIVLIQRMQQLAADVRDLQSDAPLHVALARADHLNTIDEAIRNLRETYKVTA